MEGGGLAAAVLPGLFGSRKHRAMAGSNTFGFGPQAGLDPAGSGK
jgi:hypothetical protein